MCASHALQTRHIMPLRSKPSGPDYKPVLRWRPLGHTVAPRNNIKRCCQAVNQVQIRKKGWVATDMRRKRLLQVQSECQGLKWESGKLGR